MLGKLTKNEIASTSKTYLPLYGLLLILALLNRILLSFNSHEMDMPQGLAMMGYVMVMTAIGVITLVLGVSRFQKNLLGDEGYLMHTLPVKKWQLISAKLIAASTWTILGAIAGMISLCILTFDPEVFRLMGQFFQMLGQYLAQVSAWDIIVGIFYCVVFIVLGLASTYLPMYLAMALGNMNNKNRTLASIGWFLGICFGWQVISASVFSFVDRIDFFSIFNGVSGAQGFHIAMWSVILYFLVFNGLCFFGTNWALSKKLNLQ